MSTSPAAPPRPGARKRERPAPAQLPPYYCPHTDAELDESIRYDVADLAELRLLAALAGDDLGRGSLALVGELP